VCACYEYACYESQLADRQVSLDNSIYPAFLPIQVTQCLTKVDGRVERRKIGKKSKTESKYPSDAHIHPHDFAPLLLSLTDN